MSEALPAAVRAPGLLRAMQLWTWIAALYYVQAWVSGDLSSIAEESSTHKFFKYGVCLALGLYACLRTRRLLPIALMQAFLLVAVANFLALGHVTIFGTVAVTLGAMVGLVALGDVHRADARIAMAIVASGALVGLLAIVEVYLLGDHMAAIWRATNSVRAISTLLNPNNLGLYMGCALILVFGVAADRDKRWRVLLAVPLVAGLLLSGSRTAYVALAAVLVFDLFRRGKIWSRVMQLGARALAAAALLAVLAVAGSLYFSSADYGVEEAYRGFDPYTAQLRWELLLRYAEAIDASMLLPDYADTRAHLVQDSFYTMLGNAFGIGAGLLALALFVLFATTRDGETSQYRYVWSMVLVFYLVSGLGGSFLTSFPNNQVFFIALGMVLTDRLRRREPSAPSPEAVHG